MRDEYDFSKGKRAKDIPHLAKLQKEVKGKSRITIMLDDDVLDFFRARAEERGIGYQTLINATLREALGSRPVDEATLRRVLREELQTS
ncbi:MAG: BrnA antitoxin family protein [Candidatus Competibacteraceae bacterium]|nr:BrnA antitoxin family protein [Candidatus Competibacteraceae bacterium]MCB1812222.1 BrnA antitoxin family protein [Candidatus Competibacteraceae bacterium]